mmetsp:Transcript_87315/g.250202  ORF Transcript_87315/g.250202 Transcript_87315/m.250202 type:complete len:223 (+) Transcript_87315:707-1375(+)
MGECACICTLQMSTKAPAMSRCKLQRWPPKLTIALFKRSSQRNFSSTSSAGKSFAERLTGPNGAPPCPWLGLAQCSAARVGLSMSTKSSTSKISSVVCPALLFRSAGNVTALRRLPSKGLHGILLTDMQGPGASGWPLSNSTGEGPWSTSSSRPTTTLIFLECKVRSRVPALPVRLFQICAEYSTMASISRYSSRVFSQSGSKDGMPLMSDGCPDPTLASSP